MAELTNITTLVNGDVFDPQVVSDMINAKVEKKAVMTGYIKMDSTLSGVPGSTVTVPRWGYIGEAVELTEGQTIDTTKMAFTTAQYGIKKIGKGVMLTDLLFVGAVFIAVGLFVSSLTENQLAAAVGTIAILIAFLGVGLLGLLLPTEYWLRYVLDSLSIFTRFSTFTNGYFDLASVVYYASVTAIFLYLTVRVYDRRRYH